MEDVSALEARQLNVHGLSINNYTFLHTKPTGPAGLRCEKLMDGSQFQFGWWGVISIENII